MTDCKECENAETKGWKGTYNATCAACCSRLIESTRPSVVHRDAMFNALRKFKGSPSRAEISKEIKRKQELGVEMLSKVTP